MSADPSPSPEEIHEPVARQAVLWRRLPKFFFVPDADGQQRLSTKAFQDDHTSVSVAGEITAGQLLEGFEFHGIAELAAAVPLDLGLAVLRFPIETNPAHAQIEGKASHGKKNAMVKACKIVKLPDDL
ncbi:MAG: hypothetical protein ACO1Q7_09420 [Gemmatimonas sp.]